MVTQLTVNSIAVQVPTGSRKHCVTDSPDKGAFCVYYEIVPIDDAPSWDISDNLPPGSWQILGRGKELTEEQWKEIVPRIDGDLAWIPSYNDPDSGGHGFCYDDYESEDEHTVYYTATESGLSLLKYKNVPIDNVIILVKAK